MTENHARFRVIEASISELRQALDTGVVTSVELVARYLNRIAFYDRHGIRLNAVPVLNPEMFADARAADARRSRNESLGLLDGIPYTAKDSYKAKGLAVASGSPAFEHLIARDDAFTIAQLRAAGAILIGLTNMPPMAGGGAQRGVYGRAESPYNENFLTTAYASGSSNGSGTATGASFAAFGLGEETWSSGRAPAACNGLVAYTPSRGVISVRGNWPLVPTMDVVVPHTRSVADLLEVLDTVVADDPEARGDFWRMQPWIDVPATSEVRPDDYGSLRDPEALRGKRLGVPRMYINNDDEITTPIQTRASIVELWGQARRDLEALGAKIVEVDFPLVSNYERDRPDAQSMVDRGLVPEGYAHSELWDLTATVWDDFLDANGDPALNRLADVDGAKIFPTPPGTIPDHYEDEPDMTEFVELARAGLAPVEEIPLMEEGLRGLDETRRVDYENWLDSLGLDALVLPTLADVAPYDSDLNPTSNEVAWRNGVWVANGNLVFRHFGLPTVNVPMGVMADIGMPAGLTFAGRPYCDNVLLSYAYAFDVLRNRRVAPPRTPALPSEEFQVMDAAVPPARSLDAPEITLRASVSAVFDGTMTITVNGTAIARDGVDQVQVFVNGESVPAARSGDSFEANVTLPSNTHYTLHSHWRGPYGSIVTVIARGAAGSCAGAYTVVGGVA